MEMIQEQGNKRFLNDIQKTMPKGVTYFKTQKANMAPEIKKRAEMDHFEKATGKFDGLTTNKVRCSRVVEFPDDLAQAAREARVRGHQDRAVHWRDLVWQPVRRLEGIGPPHRAHEGATVSRVLAPVQGRAGGSGETEEGAHPAA